MPAKLPAKVVGRIWQAKISLPPSLVKIEGTILVLGKETPVDFHHPPTPEVLIVYQCDAAIFFAANGGENNIGTQKCRLWLFLTRTETLWMPVRGYVVDVQQLDGVHRLFLTSSVFDRGIRILDRPEAHLASPSERAR